MKNFRKMLMALVAFATLMVCFAFSASALEETGKCGDNAYWSFNSDTGHLLISGSGTMYSSAFADKREIKSVSIREGITNVSSRAFSRCYYLDSVVLPESLVSIGRYAFSHTGLTALAIPKNVSNIEAGFVMQCNKLYGIVVHPDNKYFEVLYSGSSDARFLVTEDLRELVQYSCGHHATSIVIPDEIKVIRDLAFNCAWNLRSVYLPKNLEYIGSYAFAICIGLESIIIPESVKTIAEDAFTVCYQLEDVYINSKDVSLLNDSVCKQIKTYIGKMSRNECYNMALDVFKNKTIKEMLEFQDKYLIDAYPTEPYGTIHCKKNSTAETYAKNNGIDYTYIDGVYNFGEETYRFKNADVDPKNGHCFGMSITSSGYYLGLLDKSSIGLTNNNSLYSLELTDRVRAPIDHYQEIQGQARDESIVAGGTSFKYYPIFNVKSDWKSVVNYVKDHKHDGKGDLIVGYTEKYKIGGHAVNFLRYEIVDGQERIYVYDNNFPNVETYFYQNSNGDIKQSPRCTYSSVDTIALVDVRKFISKTGNFIMAKTFYALADTISIEGAYESALWMDDTESELMMYEILDDETKIIITPLVENATFTYMGNEYSFNEVKEDTYAEFTLSTFEEDEPLFEVKNEPHEHIDSEWIIDKDSTCSAEGLKHIECTVCEEVLKTEAIAKLPHKFSSVVTEATCETGGYTTYTCYCGYTYTGEKTPAKGHDYAEGVCKNCGDSKVDGCSCNCHKSGFMGFIWKIVRFFYKLLGSNKVCTCGVAHY